MAGCAQCFTLNFFRDRLPVEAAAKGNVILSFERLLSQYSSLPTADIRLVEGAVGLRSYTAFTIP
jgi:dethiobiotin synthetase